MTTETEQPQAQQRSGGGLGRRMTRRALEPVVASVVTAASAYVTRKGVELFRDRVLPKLQEKGGVTATARETLETVAEKVTPDSSSDDGREQERRQREQRRNQRRRTLEQSAGSS